MSAEGPVQINLKVVDGLGVAVDGRWFHPPPPDRHGGKPSWEDAVVHKPGLGCPLGGRHPRSECRLVSAHVGIRFK